MPDPRPKLGKGTKGKLTQEMLSEQRGAAGKSPKSYSVGNLPKTKTYDSNPAPRVGGQAPKSQGMAKGTAKKSPIKKAIRKVNKTAAHPAAKAAAKRTYR